MTDILNLLNEDPNVIDIEDVKNKIQRYYQDNNRHSYARISEFMYDNCESGDFEYISENLTKIISIMEKEENPCLAKVNKLLDHIELENLREVHVKDYYVNYTQQLITSQRKRQTISIERQKQELLLEIQDSRREFSNDFSIQKEEIDKLNGNIVSVLGIFGAIIVAFFGGLSFLGGVLNNMHQVSAYRLTFTGVIFLVGLFNIIFLLLFCISKLVKKPLWSSCDGCNECVNYSNNNRLKCSFKKYPLVISFNIIAIFLMFSIILMYSLDKYNICAIIIEYIGLNSKSGLAILLCGILIYLSIVILLLGTIIIVYRHYNCKKEDNTNNYKNNDIKAEKNTVLQEVAPTTSSNGQYISS